MQLPLSQHDDRSGKPLGQPGLSRRMRDLVAVCIVAASSACAAPSGTQLQVGADGEAGSTTVEPASSNTGVNSATQAEVALITSVGSSLGHDFSSSERTRAQYARLGGDELQQFLRVGQESGVIFPDVATLLANSSEVDVLVVALDNQLPHPHADSGPLAAEKKVHGDTVFSIDDPVTHAGVIRVADSETLARLAEFFEVS